MTRSRLLHRYLGLFASIFLLVLSVTGILLNHSEWYAGGEGVTVPEVSLQTPEGLWLGTSEGLHVLTDEEQAPRKVRLPVPSGEVSHLYQNETGLFVVLDDQLLCVKRDGVPYWERVRVPSDILMITHLSGDLQLTTEQGIFYSKDTSYRLWEKDSRFKSGSSFKKTLLLLHTGLWATPWMVFLHDAAALILIVLILTGFWIVFRKR